MGGYNGTRRAIKDRKEVFSGVKKAIQVVENRCVYNIDAIGETFQ